MDIKGWKYYNHAAIPATAPHENPDITPVENGDIWNIDGKTPLLARWTTEFDCGYETNWWYVVRQTPYSMEDVSSKERKSIRQAVKKCYVKKVQLKDHIQQLYDCYYSAFQNYENIGKYGTYEQFEAWCVAENETCDCWAGYDAESNRLIGYMTVLVYDDYAEIVTAKFMPEFLNRQVSDALYHNVLDFYLNTCKKNYVSSGSRSISHITNTQQYKIRRFGYKKAYCRLHIAYNPKITILIKLVFPFRKILFAFDGIHLIHQLNAVLRMEEIHRSKGYDLSHE